MPKVIWEVFIWADNPAGSGKVIRKNFNKFKEAFIYYNELADNSDIEFLKSIPREEYYRELTLHVEGEDPSQLINETIFRKHYQGD